MSAIWSCGAHHHCARGFWIFWIAGFVGFFGFWDFCWDGLDCLPKTPKTLRLFSLNPRASFSDAFWIFILGGFLAFGDFLSILMKAVLESNGHVTHGCAHAADQVHDEIPVPKRGAQRVCEPKYQTGPRSTTAERLLYHVSAQIVHAGPIAPKLRGTLVQCGGILP